MTKVLVDDPTPARAVSVAIREATPADADRLHALTEHFLTETPYAALLKTPTATRFFSLVETVLEFGVILVAEVDGEVQGMLALAALEHPVSGEVYGDELVWWVEPEHRGSGIGPRLLRKAEAWAKSRGLRMLKMVAPAGSDVGEFYERMGYQAVETAYQLSL